MREAHHVATVRAAEDALRARLPAGTLMARAAAGLAAVVARLLPAVYGARVVLLVGAGDNGGDTLYAGVRLARRGARVDAVLLRPERTHAAGLAALIGAGGRVAAPGAGQGLLAAADVVLDGVVGLGGRPGLAGPAAGLAAAAAAGPGRVVAVDLPSGVDPDTGEVGPGAVRADLTVTFGTGKPGLYVDPGAAHAGLVVVVDLGLAPELPDRPALRLAQAADVAALLPRPAPDWDKYRRGVLGVAAGSPAYTGAAVLCAGGALATGVGMVRVLADPPVAAAVRARWPEAVVTVARDETDPLAGVGRVQAWVAGPGSGTDPAAAARLSALLGTPGPLLVDADGLTVLGRLLDADPDLLRQRAGPTLLTPHAGELARLLSADRAAVEARRRAHVQEAVDRWGATVLLKGRTTLVAGPGQVPWANPTGTPWLATAGTGDVLAGVCGALLAAGLPADAAAAAGAWLHGVAGRYAAHGGPLVAGGPARGGPLVAGGPARGGPLVAGDVVASLPAVLRDLSGDVLGELPA